MAPGGARLAHQFVAGIGDQWSPGVGDQGDRLVRHLGNQPRADAIGIVIVIGGHRPLDADMREQLGGDPAVLDGEQIRGGEHGGGVRA
jgi:hypothetical protein